MSNISISIKLLESDSIIRNKILRGIVKDINRAIPPILNNVKQQLKIETIKFFQNTEAYQSLLSGDLAAHFGIPILNRRNNLNIILETIGNNIEVTYKPIKIQAGNFTNGLTIEVLLSDLSDILALPQAVIITEKGDLLEWLSWLLTAGDKIIIRQYEIDLVEGEGRSGGGVMIESATGVWRVPPEFSGSVLNNWLTKALLLNADAYLSIIDNILKKELKGI